MRQETIDQIKKEKLIVIVRGIERKKLIPLAEAMYNGGIRLLEVTYSANGKVSDEKTAENIRALVTHFGNKMCIGAGTVLTEKQVELTKNAGGCFIISPNTKESVIKRTVGLGMVSIPGAFSPSEIEAAHEFGADFVKLSRSFDHTLLGVRRNDKATTCLFCQFHLLFRQYRSGTYIHFFTKMIAKSVYVLCRFFIAYSSVCAISDL